MTQRHVHLVTTNNGMSLSARSVNADKRGSGIISAFFMSEESQLREVGLTGVITLDGSTIHLAQSGDTIAYPSRHAPFIKVLSQCSW